MTLQIGGVRQVANAQNVALLPATTAATVGTFYGATFGGLGWATTVTPQLNVTALATDGGDTLDVYLQTTIDGTNWLDVVHFTQQVGSGSAVVRVVKIVNALAQAEYATSSALGAAAVRHVLGDLYRVKYVVAQDDAASFTFSVTANFE